MTKTLAKRLLSALLCLSLAAGGLCTLTGCALKVRATDLMDGVTAGSVSGREPDDRFATAAADFAVRLFRQTQNGGESVLVSPLSVMLALTMTANGADGQTRVEMERLLGGDVPLDELNEYLLTYVKSLVERNGSDKTRVSIANSIWFRDRNFTVERDFLQTNADYFGAAAYKSAFDRQTVDDINRWVRANTDGLVDKMIDEINDDAVMFLINTVLFDAEWQEIYEKGDVHKATFTTADGQTRTADFMNSTESYYLDDSRAIGFVKRYKGGYSFVALLPNPDESLADYVASMTGESFLATLKNAKSDGVVYASLPKFSYECSLTLNDTLKSLGATTAFDPLNADFSRLGHVVGGNIWIDKVLHKTKITVGEKGTKAGAVTSIEMVGKGAMQPTVYKVTLDRPFVYAIIDDATRLPLFIGTVTDVGK